MPSANVGSAVYGNTTSGLTPVELPFWPTCRDALTWSSDALAVAAGEVVHILTPRDKSISKRSHDHKPWHVFTQRVNQFELSEWPFQRLAPINDFSIGEELSESNVVALSWSPDGLGMYRRSVLAVLTSNLILSFWETDGQLGVWQRTCLVNSSLPRHEDQRNTDSSRRQSRIRSFLWLPALRLDEAQRWGEQLLLVADDNRCLLTCRVWKEKDSLAAHWRFELLCSCKIESHGKVSADRPRISRLHRLMQEQSPISKIEATDWKQDLGTSTATMRVRLTMGEHKQTHILLINARKTPADPLTTKKPVLSATLAKEADTIGGADLQDTSPALKLFSHAIHEPRSNFDLKFNLGGKIRVRWWGTAYSPNKSLAAACLSLHPSDVIEYGTPASQTSTIVFVHTRNDDCNMPDTGKDGSDICEDILNIIADTSVQLAMTKVDNHIIRNAAALIQSSFTNSSRLLSWAQSIQHDHMHSSITLAGTSIAEACDICGSAIPFESANSAKCLRGHVFTRCSMSFLAIQEPGISMYCSECGRQFLDPGKLKPAEGPSLTQVLFDKFDVCPYCQGKYRG